jgi:hypothetical protein
MSYLDYFDPEEFREFQNRVDPKKQQMEYQQPQVNIRIISLREDKHGQTKHNSPCQANSRL